MRVGVFFSFRLLSFLLQCIVLDDWRELEVFVVAFLVEELDFFFEFIVFEENLLTLFLFRVASTPHNHILTELVLMKRFRLIQLYLLVRIIFVEDIDVELLFIFITKDLVLFLLPPLLFLLLFFLFLRCLLFLLIFQ